MSLRDKTDAAPARHWGAALCTAAVFLLTYNVFFAFRGGQSDFLGHIVWGIIMTPRDMLASFTGGWERLWHILVNLTYRAVGNVWVAAALVTSLADTAAYVLAYFAWDRMLPRRRPARWLLALVLACVFAASSLTMPGHGYYFGRSPVNTWHNPTNIMVRPFAAAVFYMTVDIYRRYRYGSPDAEQEGDFSFQGGFWAQFRRPVYTRVQLVADPLCALLSVYAKPSFLQFFAPAIFLFLLVEVFRTKGMLLPFCLKLALGYLPAGLVMGKIFLNYFWNGFSLGAAAAVPAAGGALAAISRPLRAAEGSIAVYFMSSSFSGVGDFLSVLGGWLRSCLMACAFPLFLLLISPKKGWRDTAFRLGWCCLIVGLLEAMLLHETGERADHGNFYWGYYLSIWMLWTAAAARYASLVSEGGLSGKLARYGGTALLLWHMACGAGYIQIIFQTRSAYH